MLDRLLTQLETVGDGERAAAIREWIAEGDPVRLKVIATVYRSIRQDTLRQIAAEADTRLNARPIQRSPNSPLALLDDSVTSYLLDDKVKAAEYLSNFLHANPDWADSPIIADYGAMLLRLPQAQAIALLTGSEREMLFGIANGARWWQLQDMAKKGYTPRKAIRNVGAYAVLFALMIGLIVWGVQQFVRSSAFRGSDLDTMAIPSLGITLGEFAGAGNTLLIGLPILFALLYTLELLARSYVIHVTATVVNSTQTPYLYWLHRFVALQTGVIALLLVGAAGVVFLIANTLDAGANRLAFEQLGTTFSQLLTVILGVAVLYGGALVYVISDTYHIGYGSGCATFIIATVIMAVLMLVANALIGLALPPLIRALV